MVARNENSLLYQFKIPLLLHQSARFVVGTNGQWKDRITES